MTYTPRIGGRGGISVGQHLPAFYNMPGVLRRVAPSQVHGAIADYYLLYLPLLLLPPTHATTPPTHRQRPIAVPVLGQPFPFMLPPPARACACAAPYAAPSRSDCCTYSVFYALIALLLVRMRTLDEPVSRAVACVCVFASP